MSIKQLTIVELRDKAFSLSRPLENLYLPDHKTLVARILQVKDTIFYAPASPKTTDVATKKVQLYADLIGARTKPTRREGDSQNEERVA